MDIRKLIIDQGLCHVGLLGQENVNSVLFICKPQFNPLDYVNKNNHCILIHDRKDIKDQFNDHTSLVYNQNPRLAIIKLIEDGILADVYGIDYTQCKAWKDNEKNISVERLIGGENLQLADRVSIGVPDFYALPGDDGNLIMMPQLGTVTIGKNVYIGHNSTVARGTFGTTEIGDYTKIDSECWIPHNCKIGKNCVLTTGVKLCGSTEVGDETFIGVGTIVNQWVKIGKHCTIGSGSVVIKDIPDGCVAVGNPARIIKTNTKFDLNTYTVKDL